MEFSWNHTLYLSNPVFSPAYSWCHDRMGDPPPHHRSVAPQSVYPSPTVSTRQSLHACPGSFTSSSHGSAVHIGGLHPHPNPPQPSSLSRLLLSKPTLLFSGSPIRSKCGPIHFHQGHGLASPHPPHPGDQYPRLPRRYRPLASLPPHSPPTRGSHDRETLCHGVSGQSPEIPAGTSNDFPMAGHPLASADKSLAGVPKHQGQNPVVYPPAPSHRPHHPQAPGGSGGPHQFCLSGAQPFEGLPPTSHGRSVPSFPPGQRCLSTHSPSTPPCVAVLGGSQHLVVHPALSGDPTPSFSLDGRLALGMGRSAPSSGHNPRPLGATGGSSPHQCAQASSGQLGHLRLQPVVLSPCRVYRRDSSFRPNAPPHSLSSVARGTEKSVAQHDQTTGVSASAPHPHHPQCGSGRPEPTRATQYRVDAASRGLQRDSSLGRSPPGGSPGLADQLPSSAVGLPFSSPGCSGLQLSKFRLERLRQHLCVPTGRPDSDPAATHPRLQRPSRPGGSLGPTCSLVALSPPTGTRSPAPADDAIPILRPRPGLPQVGDLHSLDHISFLRRALLTSRPVAVVNTLLASYCSSSQRQQEVAWTAFRHWLPLDRSTVTKDDILAFLQYLFSTKSLTPNTILNFRAALQWPLEEAFSVDFSHPDIS